MAKVSKYQARTPDARGIIHYTDAEHAMWRDLMARQRPLQLEHACPEYLQAFERLALPEDRIPQCADISRALQRATGWQVVPVPALISFTRFFELLVERRFPAASFIRTREDMDYLEEPDIFHEIVGHTPLLTDPRFAAFTHAYGKAGLAADKRDHAILAKLYWFTVEFGLIAKPEGLRAYGAGLMSSPGELPYALHSDTPVRKTFDAVEALRTPYRIDIFQTVYFVIDDFDVLFELANSDLNALVARARTLGMRAPTFPPKPSAA